MNLSEEKGKIRKMSDVQQTISSSSLTASSNSVSASTPSISSSYVQLGHKYRQGIDGIELNYKEAARLYQLAAQQGDDEGEAWLAFFYLWKWGGFNNPSEAFRLSQIGVQKKIPLAYQNLGLCYQDGRGVKKRHKKSN